MQDGDKAQLTTAKKTVILRDVDNITADEEIANAVQSALNTVTEISVKRSKNGSKKQPVFISLSESHANALIKMGKIQIGWCQSRIHELMTPVRCYKCQRYGHKAEECKLAENDMRERCLTCCDNGHIAKNCKSKEKCYQCSEEGQIAGSMGCPIYRKLVGELRASQGNTKNPPTK